MKTHGEDRCAKAGMGRCFYKARNGKDRCPTRKLGERSGAYSPWESSVETNPATTSGLQNRREHIPVILSHLVCGPLLQQPQLASEGPIFT